MRDDLTLIEELNIEESLREPFSAYVFGTLREKKAVAYSVFKRSNDDLILISSSGFHFDSVFAGLKNDHVQFILQNGPIDYKRNLLEVLQSNKKIEQVYEIAKSMDEDFGENTTPHQERIKNVIQYIKDNRVVFEF